MIALERAFLLDADVVSLVLAQLGELHADLGEMQARDLLVERGTYRLGRPRVAYYDVAT